MQDLIINLDLAARLFRYIALTNLHCDAQSQMTLKNTNYRNGGKK